VPNGQIKVNKIVVSETRKWHRLLHQGTVLMKFPKAKESRPRVRTPKSKKQKRRRNRLYGELLLRLQLESNPEALGLVRAVLERATELSDCQESASRAVVRSVDEALANVIRHAYQEQPGLPIEVTFRRLFAGPGKRKACGLEILVSDEGIAPDKKKLRGRPFGEIRPGGLGLHFMKQSMDKVEFQRKKGRNVLRMVKYLA
jgi:serine/threonine-protein kinase RsbW